MLERLLREKLVDYVAMDVKTSLAEYPKLVGKNVNPEQIRKSIELLKHSNIPYEFRTTLIKEMHSESVLADMKELLQGAKQCYFQVFRPEHTLHSIFATYHPFSEEEMKNIVKQFSFFTAKVGLRA